MTAYGDAETGAIITPALRGLGAQPVGRPSRTPCGSPCGEYRRPSAGTGDRRAPRWVELVGEVLDEAGINYLSVTGRTKTRRVVRGEGGAAPRRGCCCSVTRWSDIIDQVGIRVITYVQSDVAAVADLLREEVVVTDDRDMGEQTAVRGALRLRQPSPAHRPRPGPAGSRPAGAAVGGQVAQVQVRTVLQHAWAEFEHEARYKGNVPAEHAHDLDRRFTLAAGLLELADEQLSAIREKLREAGARRGGGRGARRPPPGPRRAGRVPGRAVRRRRLVARRSLRLDLRAAARAGHHPVRRARRGAPRPGGGRAQRAPRATASPRERCAASTTPCWRSTASDTSCLTGNAHRAEQLRSRLDRMR